MNLNTLPFISFLEYDINSGIIKHLFFRVEKKKAQFMDLCRNEVVLQ